MRLISNLRTKLPGKLTSLRKVSLRSENHSRRIAANWKSTYLHWRPTWFTICMLHTNFTVPSSYLMQNFHHAKSKTSPFTISTVECSGVRKLSKLSKGFSVLTHQPTQFTTLVQHKIARANTMEATRIIVAFIAAPSANSLKC